MLAVSPDFVVDLVGLEYSADFVPPVGFAGLVVCLRHDYFVTSVGLLAVGLVGLLGMSVVPELLVALVLEFPSFVVVCPGYFVGPEFLAVPELLELLVVPGCRVSLDFAVDLVDQFESLVGPVVGHFVDLIGSNDPFVCLFDWHFVGHFVVQLQKWWPKPRQEG